MRVVTVRPATVDDVPLLLTLLRELAAFERGTVCASEDDLRRDGFGTQPRFEALLAERDGQVLGFITLLPTYSSWQGRPALMIHDLFIREDARGNGAGHTLVEAAAALAAHRGCGRVDVNVLGWNERARAFYERLGFVAQTEWVLHRLAMTPHIPDA